MSLTENSKRFLDFARNDNKSMIAHVYAAHAFRVLVSASARNGLGSVLPRTVAGKSKKVRDRQDALASTRDGRATLDFLRSLRIKNAVEVYA